MTFYKTGFEAIGTRWSITCEAGDALQWDELVGKVHEIINQFDITYSRFRKDSQIAKLRKTPGSLNLPYGGHDLFDVYNKLYKATGGAVTPLIGQAMEELGYDSTYSLKPRQAKPVPAWEDIIQKSDSGFETKKPVLLDVGAAGKGKLVDNIGEYLHRAGVKGYVVDAGGDIAQWNSQDISTTIGLENPYDHSEVIGTTQIHNQSLCASAGSKRAWGDLHHIISPKTLSSPSDIVASWVVAKNTMIADGLATALFFVPAEKLRSQFEFEYALLGADNLLEYSKGFGYESVAA